MRVDTAEVETNIQYPTHGSMLGRGAVRLMPLMKKITAVAGELGT